MQTQNHPAAENVRPFARQTARIVTQEELQKLGLAAEVENSHTFFTTPFPEAP
jgi:hypothetical protein